ncbi:hypothetical protein [Sinomonas susongensis]|uniref:hypothetical protein n=1 Tax=Sinomonas susongensis TaxID=1324851 RepID=UPI001FEB469E|nr:hypothetical protein [Sinomonas susongensis]
MQTATLGIDRHFAGVASAMVNTSQQVGGSIGTALLNALAATAFTDYVQARCGQLRRPESASSAAFEMPGHDRVSTEPKISGP